MRWYGDRIVQHIDGPRKNAEFARRRPLPGAVTRQRGLVSRSRAICRQPTCANSYRVRVRQIRQKKRGGSAEKLTLEQIKSALADTANNITKAAMQLHCHRDTLYSYIQRYPELQEHRKQVVAAMCDKARSNVHHAVIAGDLRTSIIYLRKHDPEWADRSTIKHKGVIQHEVQPAGLMSKAEIAALSDAELERLIAALKAEQADVEAEMARLEAQGSTPERDSELDRA
jgi:uncharacterized small protein (DUF1192 family)